MKTKETLIRISTKPRMLYAHGRAVSMTAPAEWLRRRELDAGDQVDLYETPEGHLLVVPHREDE